MKKIKKLVALVMLVTMIASLTACGAGKSSDGTKNDKVTVTFWDENAGDQRTEYYQKIIADFEKENPNIDIEYLGLSSSDALSKYQTAIAAGETPDVGGVNAGWAATLIGQGHCVALDDKFNSWSDASNIEQGYLDISRKFNKDGKLYMMPTSSNFICMWTNDQMFKDAGLTAPKTWNDFFTDAQKLTNKDSGKYGYTIRGGASSPAILIDFIYSYLGTNEVFDSNGKSTINCDKAVEFLKKYVALYGNNTPESDITAGYKEISANFDSGVSAMFTHNLGSYGSHVTAFGGNTGFTCEPLPTADNGKYVNNGGALTGLCMFDTCKNKDAAWKWISYMCEHDANSYWNQSIGQLPTNKSCYNDDWIKGMQHIQCSIDTMKKSNCITYTSPSYLPDWGSINSTYMEPAFQSLLSGEMSPKDFLDMWAGYLNDSYKNYMSK